MATVDLLAGEVMRISAALLNDSARTVYTYVAQVPYLNIAMQELDEYFQLNDIPATQETTSAAIPVNAGVTSLQFNVIPGLPDDMVEPKKLWERTRNTGSFVPMTRRPSLSHNLDLVLVGSLGIYVWEDQMIKFFAANGDNDIKIDYLQRLFTTIVDENSVINIINAKTFLEYRCAALCAEFIGENKTRADDLNDFAGLAIDRTTGIGSKTKQVMVTRRKPFRGAYKRR